MYDAAINLYLVPGTKYIPTPHKNDNNETNVRMSEDENAVTANTLKTFIDGGLLEYFMREKKLLLFPYVKFVAYRNGKMRILLGGRCPSCHSTHLQNTCNIRYVNECIAPIVKQKFKNVKVITPVLTHDTDFESIVKTHGGRVTLPHDIDVKKSFQDQRDLILDQHPDVDSHFKMFQLKEGYHVPPDTSRQHSRRFLCDIYDVMWLIDENTTVVTKYGHLLSGK